MTQAYTAAIVGCGDIAHYHVRGYQLAGVELVGVVDPLEVAREQYREEYGIARGWQLSMGDYSARHTVL